MPHSTSVTASRCDKWDTPFLDLDLLGPLTAGTVNPLTARHAQYLIIACSNFLIHSNVCMCGVYPFYVSFYSLFVLLISFFMGWLCKWTIYECRMEIYFKLFVTITSYFYFWAEIEANVENVTLFHILWAQNGDKCLKYTRPLINTIVMLLSPPTTTTYLYHNHSHLQTQAIPFQIEKNYQNTKNPSGYRWCCCWV